MASALLQCQNGIHPTVGGLVLLPGARLGEGDTCKQRLPFELMTGSWTHSRAFVPTAGPSSTPYSGISVRIPLISALGTLAGKQLRQTFGAQA